MTVFAQVQALVADVLGVEPSVLGAEASMETVDAWDSFQHLAIMMALEEEFGVEVTPEELLTTRSLAAMADLVMSR
jgi:acyl carrier protein